MKRIGIQLATIVAALFFSINSSAQVTEISVPDSMSVVDKRLRFGFGFGLSFVGGTNIAVSPNLMYSLSNKVSIGAGLQGSYTSIKNLQNTFTYGGNIITQYQPIEKLILLLEFTQLKVNTKTEAITGDIEDDYWDSALFIGAGLNINKNIAIGAKYNVLYDKDESVYTSPILPFVNIAF
ncbi:alpha-ketoglutarate decarboxylase [Zobellia sp.]|nr:alpha-ketoglutarate decarboxylase [Zobellia sp.]